MFDQDGICGGSRCFLNIFMNTSLYRNSICMNTIESGNTAPLQGWLDSLSASPLSGSQICLCAHKHTILQVTMTLSSQGWMEARSITQMNILLQWNIVKREQLQLYAGPWSYILLHIHVPIFCSFSESEQHQRQTNLTQLCALKPFFYASSVCKREGFKWQQH